MNYIEILHLLEENEFFVIAGTETELEKYEIWPTNYLSMVDVWEKVGDKTRGLVVHVRGTLINIFMKLRQRGGKYYGLE